MIHVPISSLSLTEHCATGVVAPVPEHWLDFCYSHEFLYKINL